MPVALLAVLVVLFLPSLASAQHAACGGHRVEWIGGPPRAMFDRGPAHGTPVVAVYAVDRAVAGGQDGVRYRPSQAVDLSSWRALAGNRQDAGRQVNRLGCAQCSAPNVPALGGHSKPAISPEVSTTLRRRLRLARAPIRPPPRPRKAWRKQLAAKRADS